MKLRRILQSARMSGLDLARNRVAFGLLVAIPVILFVLVYVTTGHRPIPVQLSAAGPRSFVADERQLSLLYIALTSISGVSAFLAFALVLRPITADRRLVFEGFGAAELLSAKLLVMTALASLVALYVTALLPLFGSFTRIAGVFIGFLLVALVYSAIGVALGAIVRREIEGMLAILLLVNIDPGWLQNPAFYAHAQQQDLIRALPAHHPGQVTMVSAFTTSSISSSVQASLSYTLAIVAVAAVAYWLRVRVQR